MMQSPALPKSVNILLFFVLLFTGLYFAKAVLVPVAIAAVLAMLLTPLCARMEKRLPAPLAAIICVLLTLLFIAAVFLLLNWQLQDLAKDMDEIEKRATETAASVREYISRTVGIGKDKQSELLKEQGGSVGGGKIISSIIGGIFSFGVNTVLVIVYVFLFLSSRIHIESFVLKIVPGGDKPEVKKMIGDAVDMTHSYLGGLAAMVGMLWVLYGIGFSIAGVRSALFFAILCGLLEIIPFIGNLTGTALTVLMVIVQGGGAGMILAVLGIYAAIQFTQTYLLEPLVVGAKVNLSPLFTILCIVIWEAVWGVPGMFLAIPVTGMIKILCDHVPALKPYGFLMGGKQ